MVMDRTISTEVEDRILATREVVEVVTQVISAETMEVVDRTTEATMVLRTMEHLTMACKEVILVRILVMACKDSTLRGQ